MPWGAETDVSPYSAALLDTPMIVEYLRVTQSPGAAKGEGEAERVRDPVMGGSLAQRWFILLIEWGVAWLAVFGAVGGGLAREDYEQCLSDCRKRFVPVLEEEKNDCAEVVRFIGREAGLLQQVLQGQRVCWGKHKAACEETVALAIPALERLKIHTQNVKDCRELEAGPIRESLWMFDTSTSCSGDGLYSNLHELVGTRLPLFNRLNALGGRYKYSRERVTPATDFHGREPICEGGLKPASVFVWPLNRFYFALESALEYAACLRTCHKPTPWEKKLWEFQDRLATVKAQVREKSQELKVLIKKRYDALSEARRKLGDFPCTPLTEAADGLKQKLDEVEKLEAVVSSLLNQPASGEDQLVPLQQQIDLLSRETEGLDLNRSFRECGEEDAASLALFERKQTLVNSVLKSDMFSGQAVEVFGNAAGKGKPCSWTPDCSIPLVCVDGRCEGELTSSAVMSILTRAASLAERGRLLPLHTRKGLDPLAEQKLVKLEGELANLKGQLEKYGWNVQVIAWKESFTAALNKKMEKLGERLSWLVTQAGEEETQEGGAMSDACRAQLNRAVGLAQSLELLKGALGVPDPVGNPRWVRLKMMDLISLEEDVTQVEASVEQACVSSDDSTLLVWQGVGIGVSVLVLATVGFVLFRLVRNLARTRGRRRECAEQ